MEETTHNLEQTIMSEITSGQLTMRSRFVILAQKFGMGSAVILTVLVAALVFTVILFYLVSADSLTYLEFGNPGIWAFLESFPFPLVITLILLIFLAGRLLAATGRVYRYSYGVVALVLLSVILVSGFGLAATNVAEHIANQRVFKPMMHPQLGQHARGVAGKVILINEKIIIVRTPRSAVPVNTTEIRWRAQQVQPEVGMFIVAVGQWQGSEFMASQIKIMRPEDLRLLRPHIKNAEFEIKR